MDARSIRRKQLQDYATIAVSWGFVPIPAKGKRPSGKGWEKRRNDPDDPMKRVRGVLHLFDANRADNVSIVTGEASGVVVMDVDKGAIDYWNELVRLNNQGQPLNTFQVQTGNEGLHVYFKYTDTVKSLPNMNRILNLPMEYRTNGGAVVFVGSIHPNTKKTYLVKSGYNSTTNTVTIMDPPDWLVFLLWHKIEVLIHIHHLRKIK